MYVPNLLLNLCLLANHFLVFIEYKVLGTLNIYPVVPAPRVKEDQIFLIEQKAGQPLGYEWDSALCVILASQW